MKYILYFKENNNSFNADIVFEGKDWMVIKPNSYESLCYWGQDTEWRLADGNHDQSFHKDQTYIAIDKDNKDKFLFDFYRSDFCDKEEDQIYIKEFLEKNSDVDNKLYTFFGEQLQYENIVEENGEYWLAVSDYSWFVDFFKVDNNIRKDFIKKVLNGDSREMFYSDYNDYDITEDFDITSNDLFTLKAILILEQLNNDFEDYDFDVSGIKCYLDVANIVKEYDIKPLENLFQNILSDANESAAETACWNYITDEIYDSFNLVKGSAKWEHFKDNKYTYLWLRFKDKDSAIDAKYRIYNFDDEWEDEYYIEYSSPYNGYYGESKDIEEGFADYLSEKLEDYDNYSDDITNDQIENFVNTWKELKEKNPNVPELDLLDEVKIRIDAKRYNL
jgi:hypothetical protein